MNCLKTLKLFNCVKKKIQKHDYYMSRNSELTIMAIFESYKNVSMAPFIRKCGYYEYKWQKLSLNAYMSFQR